MKSSLNHFLNYNKFSISKMREYGKTHTSKELIVHFRISYNSFLRYKKIYGIETLSRKDILTEHQRSVVNDYLNGYPTMQELAEKYNCRPSRICSILQKANVNKSRKDINKDKINNYLKFNRPIIKNMIRDLHLSENTLYKLLHEMNISTEREYV